jgi:SAM-dependent methyltransferase
VTGDAELLRDQLTYYRARAPEYDNWWERRAQYELAPNVAAQWWAERAELERLVDGWLTPVAGGSFLELACGTGNWTGRLVRHATEVTAVDGAPEAIAIARTKVPDGTRVRFVEADIFDWEPPSRFDAVFFSFWISHVPPGRFGWFWSLVERCLAPGGRVVLVDNKGRDGVWPLVEPTPGDYVETRTDLSSGDVHRVVKIYYEPAELADRVAPLGWRAEVTATPRFFIAGVASR